MHPRFLDNRGMAASPQSSHLPPSTRRSSRPQLFHAESALRLTHCIAILAGASYLVCFLLACTFGTHSLSRCANRLHLPRAASPAPLPALTPLSRSFALAFWGHAQYLTYIRITNPICPSSALSSPSHKARLQPCPGRFTTPDIPYRTPKWTPLVNQI